MNMILPMPKIILFVAGTVHFFLCFATDETRNKFFFDTLESSVRKAYVECTGDSFRSDINYIILWKNHLDEWTKSRDYQEAVIDYKKSVDSGKAITPCMLRAWKSRHKSVQDDLEHGSVDAVLEISDSCESAAEFQKHPASPFDFAGIPFGISKDAFVYVFKKKFAGEIIDKGNILCVENMPFGGARTFLTAFYFGKKDMLCKYEIESGGMPADSLNKSVRPSAGYLGAALEQKLGPAKREYRVGFFDIKSRELSLVKKWESPGHSAYVGLSVDKFKYYAKAVIADLRLLQENSPSEK